MPGATPPLFQYSYRGAYSSTGTTLTLHTSKKFATDQPQQYFPFQKIGDNSILGHKISISLSISFEGACRSGILTDLWEKGKGCMTNIFHCCQANEHRHDTWSALRAVASLIWGSWALFPWGHRPYRQTAKLPWRWKVDVWRVGDRC
jgi:hypothetical protein